MNCISILGYEKAAMYAPSPDVMYGVLTVQIPRFPYGVRTVFTVRTSKFQRQNTTKMSSSNDNFKNSDDRQCAKTSGHIQIYKRRWSRRG
jgi:hypothetical protein